MSRVNGNTPRKQPVKIYAAGRTDGKPIGEVRGDVFHKSIVGSKHILRKPPSIALDLQSLDDAEKAGAVWVELYDKESGKTYRARLASYRSRGRRFRFPGFGEQIRLGLEVFGHDDTPDQLPLWQSASA